ncbi:hypothetical protein HMPREF9012_1846 [Bacteroidetes bacterium oral taxon 272 str. F0290]|nr:hypothetical protein HMPREF9012_1846 [Bacteroidetes bacterium oral taxon 272 str. F0290]
MKRGRCRLSPSFDVHEEAIPIGDSPFRGQTLERIDNPAAMERTPTSSIGSGLCFGSSNAVGEVNDLNGVNSDVG